MQRASGMLLLLLAACSPASIGDYGTGPGANEDRPTTTTSDAGAPADSGAGVSPRVTLTVTLAGSGTGSVMSTPSGLTCTGKTCTGSFAAGTTVGIVPAPGDGSTFAGWAGACSGADTCTPKLDADTSVTATFETLAGTYSGQYMHTETFQGCTFNNKGTLTITVTAEGSGFASTAAFTGLELRQIPGCNVVSSNATGSAPKSPVTLSGGTLTGTWNVSVSGASGQIDLPYSATLNGATLAGSWKCTGCTGQFSLTKQ